MEVGFDVVGFDVDAGRSPRSPAASRSSTTSATTSSPRCSRPGASTRPPTAADLAGFDVAVVSVPTPLRDGAPDLRYIEAAAELLAPHVRAGAA